MPATITVTSTADDQQLALASLRAAITSINRAADANPAIAAARTGAYGSEDTIEFNIPGAGVHSIFLIDVLPDLTAPMTIDGCSQPGAHANTSPDGSNATLLVELVGGPAYEAFRIASSHSVIRGLVISGFGAAVHIGGTAATGNVVEGNYIGTDAAGSFPRGVFNVPDPTGSPFKGNFIGVVIQEGASGNTIGGTTPAARNLISGNNVGVELIHEGTSHNVVASNLIGTNAAGTAAVPNHDGIEIFLGATSNTVGGEPAVARNIISGNVQGVGIGDTGTSHNVILGNWFGVGARASEAIPNVNGVLIEAGATDNTIGDTSPGNANLIAFNGNGIVIGNSPTDVATVGNRILGNSISLNTSMGIDLGNDGTTANGRNPRAFPNHGQNTPVIRSIVGSTVTGTLDSAPNTSYRIELFGSRVIPPTQGVVLSTFVDVKTDARGHATFRTTRGLTVNYSAGLTATATNLATHDTSEFALLVRPSVVIFPAALPALTIDVPFRAKVVAAGGGNGEFTFAITSGALPAGLSLDTTTGVIAGTPTGEGPYHFTVTATEAHGGIGRHSYDGEVGVPGPAPRVLGLQRLGFHAQRTALTLSFNTALDPTLAQDVGNYSLFAVAAKGRRLRPIALAAAVYDPAHSRVTLTAAARSLDLHRLYLLRINGNAPHGLASPSGVLLDGLGAGQPGSDYTRLFGRHALAGPNRSSARALETGSIARGRRHVGVALGPGLLPGHQGLAHK